MVTVAPMLSEADFQRFSDLLRARSGMEFSGQRRADLERALERAFNEFGVPTPELLYDRLTVGPGAQAALEAFIASLTVPETYFFRNQPQFEALEQRILPELIERRRDLRRLRIWSVGCASGEEPYSLAMLLRRVLPDLAAWDVTILATDLNRSLLEKAQRGLYTAWSFRDTSSDIQAQYFTRRGSQFELSPQVRGQVTFAYLNLADDSYPSALTDTLDVDLILFRNVLIYFGEEMARRVIDRLYDALADGGWLLVGHAEPSISLFNRFTTHSFPGAIVYQKQVGAAAAGDAPVEALPRPAVHAARRQPYAACRGLRRTRPAPRRGRLSLCAAPRVSPRRRSLRPPRPATARSDFAVPGRKAVGRPIAVGAGPSFDPGVGAEGAALCARLLSAGPDLAGVGRRRGRAGRVAPLRLCGCRVRDGPSGAGEPLYLCGPGRSCAAVP